MNAPFQKRLGLAGLATMNGSTRKSANHVLRSPRQRRRAFEKAAARLISDFERRFPDCPRPETLEERDTLSRENADFAEFCGKLDRLAEKWQV